MYNFLKFSLLLVMLNGFQYWTLCQAQNPAPFFPRNDVPIQKNGITLSQAWTGGLDNPQFSEIDWNGDGWNDLFVFDKSGHSSMALVWNPNNNQFESKPAYLKHLPRLFEWALMKDFNHDGLPDLFTYNTGGCRVFVASMENGEWHFSKLFDKLKYDDSKNVFISRVDIAAFEDVDGDGDLDVLTFDSLGNFMRWFNNQAVETLGRNDTLVLELTDDCWGDFQEPLDDVLLDLGVGCNDYKAGGEHAGSTSLLLDADSDGDMDLLLGDVFGEYLSLLTNDGTPTEAFISAQDTTFPSNSQQVKIFNFPAAFSADFSQDGQADLIVAPNGEQLFYNQNYVWAYERNGDNFNFIQSDFLVEHMLDVGTEAFPQLVDYNQDGLLDLLIGRERLHKVNDATASTSLTLLENVGTATEPIFEWITDDFSNLSFLMLNGLFPAFADLDNDGDQDMIAGDKLGNLHYFENTGTTEMQLTLSVPYFFSVARYAAPTFTDFNQDGKQDLIVGEEFGKLNYFENTSTADSISFELVNDFWGTVDVRDTIFPLGYSVPLMLEDNLLVYSLDGMVRLYSGLQDSIFTLETTNFSQFRQSGKAGITAGDLDNDGFLELVVGNARGGIHLYSQHPDYNGIFSPSLSLKTLQVYPNPANQLVNVELKEHEQNDFQHSTVQFYNTLGQSWEFPMNQQIPVHQLPNGLYFVHFKGAVTKLLIQH